MNRPTHVPTEARPAPVPAPASLASHGAAVQLRHSLAGLDFAEQERRLAPAAGRPGPVQMKGEDEGFKKVADAATPLEQDKTPASMRLPEEVTSGLTTAWGESFPDGKSQEQGGILVKDEAGQYGLKRGAAGKSGSFSTNYGDKSAGEALVGSAHTHPYDESEGGHKGVSFSGADIANMVWQKDKLKIVEAGGTQFVLVRTAEFQKLVDEADTKEKQEKLQAEMKATWKTTFDAAKGKLPERAEAAVKATVAKYKLSYYKGKEGKVDRVDTSK
jgi:hypothetical protein